jgi:hypothetical protein
LVEYTSSGHSNQIVSKVQSRCFTCSNHCSAFASASAPKPASHLSVIIIGECPASFAHVLLCFLQFARSQQFALGSPVIYKPASMELPFLLAFMGIFRLAVATSSENCTFDGISPSGTLTWCPCSNGFFCAKLDVRSLSPVILPCMLNLFSRYRLIIIILLLAKLLFPCSIPRPIQFFRWALSSANPSKSWWTRNFRHQRGSRRRGSHSSSVRVQLGCCRIRYSRNAAQSTCGQLLIQCQYECKCHITGQVGSKSIG